jgi:hypothetical protein
MAVIPPSVRDEPAIVIGYPWDETQKPQIMREPNYQTAQAAAVLAAGRGRFRRVVIYTPLAAHDAQTKPN